MIQKAMRAAVTVGCLLGTYTNAAVLGMDRDSYGTWDREGGHSVDQYPYTRGQSCDLSWGAVNTARYNFTWSELDNLLQTADDQNQMFTVKVSPIDASAPGRSMPTWMFGAGVPEIVCPDFTYGYYLDAEFKTYLEEMVRAFGKHVREEVSPRLQNRIAFVRVDTGCTGDEKPYENTDVSDVPAPYQISTTDWMEFRLWVFELYRQAFQSGTGPVIPLLFQNVEPPQYQVEWNWVSTNIAGGVGIKQGGQLRGHHYAESESNVITWKPLAVDSDFKLFSRNEMDQTWQYSYFQLNVRLGMFWAALEQLNVGMSIWDWSGSCLENAKTNGFEFAATFFNTWAAELVPATARGGFCFFHEGLDSADTTKFPTAIYGSPAAKDNLARYTAICNAYASQGAQMDHLEAAAMGNVAARNPPPDGQRGYNDAGWKIRPGNYDRFITQIDPENTSKAVWRCRGTLTTSSDPYDRFGRRFDSASGKNTMYFDVHDGLTPTPGQSIKLSVVYLDKGTGQFGLLYDAVGNNQKSALTVTKVNSNTWKTHTATVTDWVFGNNGPKGADLMLTSVDSNDDIFSHIELVKLVNISMTTIGSGTVSARNDATVYSPVSGTYPTGMRLEMICNPASGWKFSGWNGGLSGSYPHAILYPIDVNTEITATFVYTGALESTDDFESGTWAGGIGWSGSWTVVPTATPGSTVQLNSAGSINRTLSVPIPNAILSFSWDMDRIASGTEYGYVDVYDSAWHTVWSQTDKGLDDGSTADLLTADINLSEYGPISKISFRLVGNADTDRFWIGYVTLSGTSVAPNNAPVFTADPINKAGATEDAAYTGQTLSGSAADADSDLLTYSVLSGPSWLSITSSGALSGTPANTDVGNNSWIVQVSDGSLTDTAVLNIIVANVNDAPIFSADPMSRANAKAETAYTGQTLSGAATDVDAGAALTYSKVSGPGWLSIASSGTLTGTPPTSNVGANSWVVQVSDGLGGIDTAALNIMVAASSPTFVASGAVASGTNTIVPGLPSGLMTGDILLLFVETANANVTILSTLNTGNWSAVASSPQGTGTTTAGTRLTAFWSRYDGSQIAPTVSDSGDHQLGRMISVRGAAASGNPWDVTAGGIEATSDTSGSIPGATTTFSNTLVVIAVAASLPDATSSAKFSNWSNSNLENLTERTDNSVAAGNGGALGIATGVKATAGPIGNTSVTLANAAAKGMLMIAIKN